MKPDVLPRSAPYDSPSDRCQPRDRLAARLLAPPLDCQLTGDACRSLAKPGHPHPANRLGRSGAANSPSTGSTSRTWHTGRPSRCRSAARCSVPPSLPPKGDVRKMIDVMAGGLPSAARGAALASWLLSAGTGPLHTKPLPLELSAAVREATRQTSSFADTAPDGGPDPAAERFR
jgi:hypothetical protein